MEPAVGICIRYAGCNYTGAVVMAAECKAIIFSRCNLFIYCYLVSIDERPAMGSQPNLGD